VFPKGVDSNRQVQSYPRPSLGFRENHLAVLIEAISVVIRADTLLNKFPGGWDAFKGIVPNQTLCADKEIVRVGFMAPQDVASFVKKLQSNGFEFLRSGEAIDIAVADQMRGLTSKCSWLEFGYVNLGSNGPRVAACRLFGSQIIEVVTPPGWKFEGSLSSTFGFIPGEPAKKGMKYLRHENGLDVYLDPITGDEMYIGRTDE
jgi:hypothetical protein